MSGVGCGAVGGLGTLSCLLTTTLLLLILTGGVAYASSDTLRSQRVPRSTNCSRPGAATTTSQPKVKVVVKPIPKPDGKVSHDPLSANDISDKGDGGLDVYGYIPEGGPQQGPSPPCHNPGPEISITTTDDSDTWKTKVIIGCTVAAAVEIIIIIVIIAYWREIRWTMRKIACPCDERPNRRGEHEAMERAEIGVVHVAAPERRDLIGYTEDYTEDMEVDGPMQTFRHPSRSRTQEALDDITEDTTPV